MPGDLAPSKPSRSDELVPLQEQLEITQAVRQQFDSLAPKRPLKPCRSDLYDEPFYQTAFDGEIPEYRKFQDLEAHTEPVLNGSSTTPAEEFVETEYYKDLNSVDKSQHHTVGTGFIQVEANGVVDLNLNFNNGFVRTKSRCNPATNDWIPSPETVFPSSNKPARSDP